jgi:signal transduction histidine kinase
MGQVSEGESERLQKNLRDGASKFASDFDRELARLFLNFQAVEFDRDKAAEAYAASFARWSQEAAYPQLIRDIYLVEAEANHEPVLRRLNRAAKQFEASAWPDTLAHLKQRFELQYQKSDLLKKIEGRVSELPKMAENKGDILQILRNDFHTVDEDIPALVIPRMPAGMNTGIALLAFHSFQYAIVTLNLDYIRQEVIPQLAARYFSGSNGLDYNLTIINRGNPQNIIYQSDATALQPDSQNDSTENFFDLRLNDLSTVVKERSSEIVEEEKKLHPKTGRISIQVFRSENRNKLPSTNAPTASEGIKFSKLESREMGSGGWQLLLKHRAGSLGAVVAGARRKNLAISFGILLLMAVSIAMILVSTRRAKRLAHQQMEFVAGVSHELRTPLAVIRSAGENLADGVIDEGAQVKRYGQLIASEGRRLTEMVEQILEFSGIQSGRKKYELRPVTIESVIEHAINACRHLTAEGGFEIRKEMSSDLPTVLADEAALSRSIQNLLTNAMKYSGDHRVIEITARNHPDDKKSEVLITVSDQGLGIAPDELAHIFEPFYRGSEVTAAQIHGNGLGLSLVKNIIEAHSGNITVTSLQGKGSAFTIHLPVAKSADETQAIEIGLAT